MLQRIPRAIPVVLVLAASPSSADPNPSRNDDALAGRMAEAERLRLKADPSDRPQILDLSGHVPVPSEAGALSSVSVDCGQATPRNENGRLHVRCTITTTTIEQTDSRPIEAEIADLGATGTTAFDEACNYLAGNPMRAVADPLSYRTDVQIWSRALAARLDEARTQTTEGQRAFLLGTVQACQTKNKDRFVQSYVSYLHEIEERTCHVGSLTDSADFEKVNSDTWVARPPQDRCGETVTLTLFRAPGSGLKWNYRSVDAYPAQQPNPDCGAVAGMSDAHEFLLTNRRVRESACRYFRL